MASHCVGNSAMSTITNSSSWNNGEVTMELHRIWRKKTIGGRPTVEHSIEGYRNGTLDWNILFYTPKWPKYWKVECCTDVNYWMEDITFAREFFNIASRNVFRCPRKFTHMFYYHETIQFTHTFICLWWGGVQFKVMRKVVDHFQFLFQFRIYFRTPTDPALIPPDCPSLTSFHLSSCIHDSVSALTSSPSRRPCGRHQA